MGWIDETALEETPFGPVERAIGDIWSGPTTITVTAALHWPWARNAARIAFGQRSRARHRRTPVQYRADLHRQYRARRRRTHR